MALFIKNDEIGEEARTDKNGQTTITRRMVFQGDKEHTVADVVSHELYPQTESALPSNAVFSLQEISVKKAGSTPALFEVDATYKKVNYSTTGNLSIGGGSEVKPWDLGIVNWDIGFFDTTVPYTHGYDMKGVWVPNMNSAGCQIVSEKTVTITQFSFSFNLKSKSVVIFNTQPVLNKDTEKINGYPILKYYGKLMPIGVKQIKVYNNNGKVKWEYYNCTVTIQINPFGWMDEMLDVGTMAKFKKGSKYELGAIYRYTPWTKNENAHKIAMPSKYGSIDDVIAAKDAYDKVDAGGWAKLPWEEVTEQMPLKPDGTLNTAAIEDPTKNPYNKIQRFRYKATAWSSYKFPEK